MTLPKMIALKVLLALLFLVPLAGVAAISSDDSSQTLSESGSVSIPLNGVWKFKPGKLNRSIQALSTHEIDHWQNIRVPANWYLEGYDISGVAWYGKTFTLPQKYANKSVTLKFSGVDYITEVWLNGQFVGYHEGYFQPFSFDISKALVFGKENRLVVKVNSPLEKQVEDWSLHKQYIKGIFGHHDTRPGGAWSDRGQEMNTGGIWAPVELNLHESAAINRIKVTPVLSADNQSATATAQMQITLRQATILPVRFQVTLKPYNFSSTHSIRKEIAQILVPGSNRLQFPLAVDKPALWWPWDQGHPNLYQLDVKVIDGHRVLDSQKTTFGFRSVRYDKAKNEWRINGRRLFLRGTNYIASQWLSEMTSERFAHDIALMKSANINVVRVHAHISAEEYYRLCDQAGLLNWQDFPLQWGYRDDDAFIRTAIGQARDMVTLFYNHPSIIAWSLINEPVWDATWMKTKYKHYNSLQNKALTDRLYDAILPMDTTRYVHPYSASSEHPWLGWYSGSWLDYMKPTQISLVAEYGAQALPDIEHLRKILPERDLWPTTDKQWDLWGFHNFRRQETFKYAKVPMGNSPSEFIHNTQSYQAKLVKLAAESYRRQRYSPVSAVFQFMFVEDWPSMNWGIVDYWRSPKLGYFALTEAYQPVLPSIEWSREAYEQGENAEFHLWPINDLPTAIPNATMTYSLRAGKELLETRQFVDNIAADSGKKMKTVSWNNLVPGQYELVFTIADHKGKVLGVNSHSFDIRPKLLDTSKITD